MYSNLKNIYERYDDLEYAVEEAKYEPLEKKTVYERIGKNSMINPNIVCTLPILSKYCLLACYIASTYQQKYDRMILSIKGKK